MEIKIVPLDRNFQSKGEGVGRESVTWIKT